MASITTRPGGQREIQFVAGDGSRKTIRLGKMTRKNAETIKLHVESLNAVVVHGLPIDSDTAVWLADIGDVLAEKLADVGLIPRRGSAKLGEFMQRYIDQRSDVKASTRTAHHGVRQRILKFFDAGCNLRDVTPADADAFLVWLKENYADGTAGRTIKRARQFFRAAVRARMIRENPFAEVKAPSEINESRKAFISREVAAAVLDACPNAEWRLIFALSRYGGLRCPSEHMALEWSNIDWHRGRFLVNSPKTGPRWVPIFPELWSYLDECWQLAQDGDVHPINHYRGPAPNLRTQLQRIIAKAGVKPWPKLFNNLRASRETELAAEYPIHVVCAWIGNSEMIAARHYLQVTDADFDRAAQCAAPALHNPQSRAAHASTRHGAKSTERDEGADVGNDGKPQCETAQTRQVAAAGPEPSGVCPHCHKDLRQPPDEGAAKSAALPADLQIIVNAWPELPASLRVAILEEIKAATGPRLAIFTPDAAETKPGNRKGKAA